MKMTFRTAAMVLLAGCAAGVSAEPMDPPATPEGVDQAQHERAFRLIQMQTFYSLPEAHRAEIIAEAEARGIELPMNAEELVETDASVIERDQPMSADEADAAFAKVSHVVSRETFDAFRPIHQRMLAGFAVALETHDVPVKPCFAPGTDPTLIMAFEDLVFGDFSRFQQTSRWQGTALNPGGASQGDPTILTYSFPTDGTTVPDGIGEGSGPNSLNSFLDGIYGGNRAQWRGFYDQIFARWGELSGNTYVLETNDDNSTLFNNAGVSGVRGDLRMAGKTIDGNSGVLAYNFFPQNGDMVIDTADNFYANTGGNSLRLRNILAHEHGHGMGQLHVCPLGSILMNPFINTGFDGPQFDDTLNAQRHYGDPFEPNDTAGAATDLGSLSVGQSISIGGSGGVGPATVDFVSVDDNSDSDFYRINVTGNGSISATATPIGFTYQEGPQTQACNTGSTYTPISFGDLRVIIRNNAGTVLATANDTGAGNAETALANAAPGIYTVEVENTGQNQIQAYRLSVDIEPPVSLPLTLTNAGPVPSIIAPDDDSETLFVLVTLNDDTLTSGPTLNIRPQGQVPFDQIPFTGGAGGVYVVNIPAYLCGADPEFFVSVTGQNAGSLTLPTSGTYNAVIGTGISDVDSGDGGIAFTVGGTITSQLAGQWIAAAPQGNDRDDPDTDFDGNGLAWLTGVVAGEPNTDVDDGTTILTSPVYDMSDGGTLSFAYWMNDTVNPIGAEDGFTLEVSINGGSSWFQIRDYSTASSWRTDSVDIGSEAGLTSQFRFRFIATEVAPGDVLECGLDAITVTSVTCENPDTCDNPADVNGDGAVDPADFGAWVAAFNANDPSADQNGDGLVTPADFSAWVSNFNVGCP